MADRENAKELERAISDYLAISRGSHLYEPEEYERAEAQAWERIQVLSEAAQEPVPA